MRRASCGQGGSEGAEPCPRLREAAEPGLQPGGLGPLKICANSRCSGIRQSEFFSHQPRVCGAPKCHKGAAWDTFLSPESEEGETVSRDPCFCFCSDAFNCGVIEKGGQAPRAGRGWQALAWGGDAAGCAPPSPGALWQCSWLRGGSRGTVRWLAFQKEGGEGGGGRELFPWWRHAQEVQHTGARISDGRRAGVVHRVRGVWPDLRSALVR